MLCRIVSSMMLSVVAVALVLTPALTATLLKPPSEHARAGTGGLRGFAARFGNRFNRGFAWTTDRYVRGVKGAIRWRWPMLAVFAGLTAVLALVFVRLPTSFLPSEDQGFAQLQYSLPPGATQERTLAAVREIERYFPGDEKRNINAIYAVVGSSQQGAGQNAGRGFLSLKPWDQREGVENSADAITERATKSLSSLRDVRFNALSPPPVRGLASRAASPWNC